MKNLIKPLAYVFALGTTLSVPSLASAGVDSNQVSENEVVISYNSYELENNSGRNELEREIRNSAKKVCGVNAVRKIRSVTESARARACYQNSVEEAMKSLPKTS